MSTTVPAITKNGNSLRWIARIISKPWAYWALFITWFAAMHLCPNNPSMWAVLIPVMGLAFVLYLGAAIIASVWGRERLGGRLLIADGLLVVAQLVLFKAVVAGFSIHPVDIIALLTLALPPLAAGALFLTIPPGERP